MKAEEPASAESKNELLAHLHHLIARNVISGDSYDSRFKGFRGELAYRARCRERGKKLWAGGCLVPTIAKAHTLDYPVYFTVTRDRPDDSYRNIYRRLAGFNCLAMFFIQYEFAAEFSRWSRRDVMGTGVKLPVPKWKVFKFDAVSTEFKPDEMEEFIDYYRPHARDAAPGFFIGEQTEKTHRDILAEYHHDDLLDLYVQRLVFDGMIGFGRVRGIPSDIDGIFCAGGEPEYFIEIKEKDLSKREPKGFGMDLERIRSLTKIAEVTGVPYYYLVRQVSSQSEREFVNWLWIDMKKFAAAVKDSEAIEGGTGMGFETGEYPTLVCPVENFTVLK